MFGMEKKAYKPFEFDLEKELKSDHKKIEETRKTVNSRVAEIKEMLRSGTDKQYFESLGVLLHGFTALNKVLDKIERS